MKILALSDKVDDLIYSPAIRNMFSDVDVILGCGDLPYYYLEYIVTMLGGPLFYVIGNHANAVRQSHDPHQRWDYPGGCENIHGHIVRYRKLLVAGLEGSMRYNNNPHFQYTDREMTRKAWGLVPGLIMNKIFHGRYLDILITHAPPRGIHDKADRCHTGFRAFTTLIERFRPQYLIHGHVHVYGTKETTETLVSDTTVLNAYGYRTLEIEEETLR